MIRKTGISAILMGFTATIKDGYKISHIELGNDVGNGTGEEPQPITLDTPDSEFRLLHRANIDQSVIQVENYKNLKIDINLDDVVVNTPSNIIQFNSVRLICGSGEVFAWRRFPTRIMTLGYRVSMEWDIVLDEVCWNYVPTEVEYPYVKLLMRGHEEGEEESNWGDLLNGDDATRYFVGRGYSADGITWSRDSTDFIPEYGEYTIYTDLHNGDFMWNTDNYEGGGFFENSSDIIRLTDGGGYGCLGMGWRHEVYLAITNANDTSMGMCEEPM